MDLKALAAFHAVAEQGSLTRAAVALGLAQSVLSRRIAALERELGGRLFHRTGRGVVPTDLGARLSPRARAIVAESEALLAEARGALSSPAGTVEVAMVPALARLILPGLCARLRREYPRIRLRALEAYSGDAEERLARGDVDIAVFNRYSRGAVRGAELLLTADVVVVALKGKLAIDGPDLPFRSLDGVPLVLPAPPNALVSVIRDLAQRQRVAIDIALEAGSSSLIHDAVSEAGLATLVPMHLAQRDYGTQRFAIARVVKPAIVQRSWMAMTTRRPATIAARTVAHLALELSRG